MRGAVNAVVYATTALALLTAFPVGARAAEGRAGTSGQAGGDRWVPSLALTTGLTIQNWDGALESAICAGCPIPDPSMGEMPLRPAATDSDLDVTPLISTSLELMTPELPIPMSPRLFVGAEFGPVFGTERIVAGEGDPGTLRSPLPEGATGTDFGEDTALGQGSETRAELTGPTFGAYAGVAFPFEFNGRPVRLRTAVAWIHFDVDASGLVVDAECTPPDTGISCNPAQGGYMREIRLQGSSSDSFQGIGPALDLEMDVGRAGPVGTSLFFGARLYRILGNDPIEFGTSETYPQEPDDPLPEATAAARWRVEVDDWMYRVGIGMRFQWLGSDR